MRHTLLITALSLSLIVSLSLTGRGLLISEATAQTPQQVPPKRHDQVLPKRPEEVTPDNSDVQVAPAKPAKPNDKARAVQPPSAYTRGSFRVTLNGFRVNHQTVDDALERDGAGDEVFLREDSFKINAAGSVAVLSREGSGSRGSIIHVRTGDSAPSDRPETGAMRFFYEGEIVQGQTAVVLFPVLWEWDSDTESQALGDKFVAMATDPRLERYVSRFITGPAGTHLTDFIKRGSEIGLPLGVTLGHGPLGLGEVGNRPIGMARSGDRYVFDPQVLILTYEAADLISRSDFGHGPGIFEMRLKDDSDLQGDYTLFLQVKRLP